MRNSLPEDMLDPIFICLAEARYVLHFSISIGVVNGVLVDHSVTADEREA